MRPHSWGERQFQSDVSTERVRRFREKKKSVSSGSFGNGNETFHGTDLQRPRARDTDTETEYTPYIPQKNGTQKPDQLCAEVFHRIVKRHAQNYKHPMKMQLIVSEWKDAIGKRPDDPYAQANVIDQTHERACATDQWQGKYREALDKWLHRAGYMDDYPDPVSDGIESAKDYLAREAARYAAQQGD